MMPGMHELLIIGIILVILFFGGKKIPEIARGLGKGMNEFKQGMQEKSKDDSSTTTSGSDNDDNTAQEKGNASSSNNDSERKEET